MNLFIIGSPLETFAKLHKTRKFVIPANPGSGPGRALESSIIKYFLDSPVSGTGQAKSSPE
jgi:hypothetical protein